MSLIVSEVYDALIEAGATVEKAKAAAAAIPVADRLVTREEFKDEKGMLKEDLTQVKSELKQDISGVRTELKQDINDVRTELKQDIGDVKQDVARLDKRIAVLNLAVFSFGPAIVGLLVKLAFFP